MEILGDTLEKIAAEKGGIIKAGVPHVIGLLPEIAEATLRSIASERGVPIRSAREGGSRINAVSGTIDFESDSLRVSSVSPSLAGEHQLKNAAVALETLAILNEHGLRLSPRAVSRGMTAVEWRGRFQIISGKKSPTIILDVCHNAAGAKAFAAAFSQKYPGRKVPMIVGFVQKKEHQVMFDALSTVASEYWLVPLRTHRAVPNTEFLEQIDFKGVPVRNCRSLQAAWSALVKPAGPHDIIPVVGSHYLVGEYLGRYNKA